jgi:hypothetical protein
MPARFCKNCIWGMTSKDIGKEGVECSNPKLENVQKENVMPLNARACPLYRVLEEAKKEKIDTVTLG